MMQIFLVQFSLLMIGREFNFWAKIDSNEFLLSRERNYHKQTRLGTIVQLALPMIVQFNKIPYL